MNIRTIFLLAFFLSPAPFLRADEEGTDIPLEAPNGWAGETIAIPPGFAPDMKLRGTEKIRFAPGMFKSNSETFFSYVLVFRLGPKEDLALKTVEREILVYYRGLAKTVAGEGVETGKFTLGLTKVEPAKGRKQPAAVSASTGILEWVEPFVTKKPQQLRLEIHTWKGKAGKFSYLFCCASPAEPEKAIWTEMRGVRAKFLKARPAASDHP